MHGRPMKGRGSRTRRASRSVSAQLRRCGSDGIGVPFPATGRRERYADFANEDVNMSPQTTLAELPVGHLGFGAMRITGPGIWGPPRDESKAIALVRRVVDRGVTFVDTADSYGRGISETLIAKVLYPYPARLVVATKGGAYATRCQPLGRQLSARAFAPRLCGQLEKPKARARRALPATCGRSPDTDAPNSPVPIAPLIRTAQL
jgi:hypothetical protein